HDWSMVGTLALCLPYGLIQISNSRFVVDASRKDADMSPHRADSASAYRCGGKAAYRRHLHGAECSGRAFEESLMNNRKLGKTGPTTSMIGLGCMGMSDVYGPADRSESIRTIHAALDAGVTLLDTGDFYGSGHNELLVGEALRGRKRDEVFVAVKFGAMRTPQRGFGGVDCRPAAVKNF